MRDWQLTTDALHGSLAGMLRPIGTSIGLLILAALSELQIGSELAVAWPGG